MLRLNIVGLQKPKKYGEDFLSVIVKIKHTLMIKIRNIFIILKL